MTHRVLLADDNPTARSMASSILASEGYEVMTAGDAEQAGGMVGEFRPGLILADVHMPGGGGVALCEAVKSFPATAKIPVLLAASRADRFSAEDAAKAGAQGLVSKPFEATALLSAVEALLPPPKGRPQRRDEDLDEEEDERPEPVAKAAEPAGAADYESAWRAATSDDEPLFVPREVPPDMEIAGAGVSAAVAMQAPRILATPESEEIPWL